MRSEANSHLQVQVPTKGGCVAQTIQQLKFVTFQSLKNHEPKSANELVRSNGKRALSNAFNLSHPPPLITWHVLMTIIFIY